MFVKLNIDIKLSMGFSELWIFFSLNTLIVVRTSIDVLIVRQSTWKNNEKYYLPDYL